MYHMSSDSGALQFLQMHNTTAVACSTCTEWDVEASSAVAPEQNNVFRKSLGETGICAEAWRHLLTTHSYTLSTRLGLQQETSLKCTVADTITEQQHQYLHSTLDTDCYAKQPFNLLRVTSTLAGTEYLGSFV